VLVGARVGEGDGKGEGEGEGVSGTTVVAVGSEGRQAVMRPISSSATMAM